MKPVPGYPLRPGRPRYLDAFSDPRLNPAAGDEELDELAAPRRVNGTLGWVT